MARFNEALQHLLISNNLNDKEGVIAALDAILKAGYDSPEAHKKFKEAVLSQKDFWNKYLNPQIPADAKSDDEEFLCPVGAKARDNSDGDPSNDFTSLTSLALAKRAELTLNAAKELQLEAIIRQKLDNDAEKKAFRSLLIKNEDGTNQFGSPPLTVANWAQAKDAAFQPAEIAQFDVLKTEARRQLLIKKLQGCDDKVLLDTLLASLNNDVVFKAQVKKLFGTERNNPQIAEEIQRDLVNEAVKHVAAKRSVSLHLKEFKKPQVLDSLQLLNAADIGEFRQALDDFGIPNDTFMALPDDKDYIDSVKKEMGAKFLIAKTAELTETDLKQMEDVAATDDLSLAKSSLKNVVALDGAGNETYIDRAVTEDSLPQIREACALNALKLRIAKCNDTATLKDLLTVTNLETLKTVLSEKGALGYADRPKFHEAFKENRTTFNSIVAAAHIRQNLALSNNTDHLKKLINAPVTVDFKRIYLEPLTTVAAEVKAVISTHFDEKENVLLARRQALLAYVKAILPKLSADDLGFLIHTRDIGSLQGKISELLGGGNGADNLLLGGEGIKLVVELHFYAAVELEILEAKGDKDLSKAQGDQAHTDLLGEINYFTFDQKIVQDAQPLITAEIKFSIQTHLAQSLIRNFPLDRLKDHDADKLIKLAKEKNLEDFKHLLTDDFGVTDTAWVNKESMEQIQKSAFIRQIDLNYTLNFGNKTHPQLFKLIENLPQEKRLALLDKPEVFRALAQASDKGEVERMLGGVRLVNDELIDGLVNENQNNNRFAKIWNYEIAATLAQIKPPIAITEKQVEEINKRLVGAQNQDTLFNNIKRTKQTTLTTRYEDTIQFIAKKIMPNPTPELYDAFGLDANGLVLGRLNPGAAVAQKIKSIKAQHDNNASLIADYNNGSKTFADLLAFKKDSEFTDDDIDAFTEVFNKSESLADFRTKAQNEDFLDAFDPHLFLQLTPQIYDAIKVQARKKAMENATSKRSVKAALHEQEVQLKGVQTKHSRVKLDEDAYESLLRLSKASLMYSFNPAFQAAAKKNAQKMAPVISELSKQCDSYIAYYANLKREAEQNARAVDEVYQNANPDKKKKLLKTRNKWVTKFEEIKSEYNLLLRLQTIFVGDPASKDPVIKQGLLKSLEEAEAGSRDFKMTTNSGVTTYSFDYLMSKRASHFTPEHVGADNPEPSTQGAAALVANSPTNEENPLFKMVYAIPPDHFREHTVVIGQDKALFLEERSPQHLVAEKNAAGEVDYQPSLKLTATKVPSSPEGKVALAMTMAMQAIGSLKEPPTKENPIRIVGLNDPEFARYLWTALMVIGDKDPNFKFGKEALKMDAARVNIDNEINWYGGWSDKSIYNTVFKNSATAQNMLDPILALNEKRFGEEEQLMFEEIVEDTTKLNTFFKPKLEKTEVQEELDKADAVRPGLGSSNSSND